MKKAILSITILSVICTIVFFCLYKASGNQVILATAITFGPTAYHFLMRLGVSFIFNRVMNNRADYTKYSWDEIAQASCQAELVHEAIILLSFVPIVFSTWFGVTTVFIITSALAALFDMTFVIIQRYSRPRIIRLIGR